jgi:hypothetical protein
LTGRHRRGGHADRPGRYEVRPGPAGLKSIVWVEAGQPPLLMTTIAADRIPLLARALDDYVGGLTPST